MSDIPKGWKLVPVRATLSMHNAAAFSKLYETPSLSIDANGYLRFTGRCPDWSEVYAVMLDNAPKAPE